MLRGLNEALLICRDWVVAAPEEEVRLVAQAIAADIEARIALEMSGDGPRELLGIAKEDVAQVVKYYEANRGKVVK